MTPAVNPPATQPGVLLVWVEDPSATEAVVASPGPWREVLESGEGLLLVESEESLSRVYHAIKALLPRGCGLLVAPLAHRPKARGLTEGSVSWLRSRLPLP